MKKLFPSLGLLLLTSFSVPVFGQNYYEQQWKIVKEQVQKGTFKSNQTIIQNIEKQAMKDKNLPELIKALKADFSISQKTFDDTENDNASQFFKKIEEAQRSFSGKEALVLDVLKAEFIKDYYNSVQWKISSRTNVDNQDVSQIETWTNLGFKNYLLKQYQAIFEKKEALKSIGLKPYEAIFDSKFDLEYYPTMLDWTSIQYVRFLNDSNLFTKNELDVNQPKILQIYDDLITANSANAKLYYQSEKLEYQIQRNPNDKSLKAQWQTLYDSPIDGDYKLAIASEIASNLLADKKEKEALEVIKNAKAKYPKSDFLGSLKNLENSIIQSFSNVHLEATSLTNKPIQALVEFKNVKTVQLKIYQVKDDILGFLSYVSDPYNSKFSSVKKTLIRTENFDVPVTNDYKQHKTAFDIKALPAGIYMLEYFIDGESSNNDNSNYFLVSGAKSIYKNISSKNQSDSELLWINSEDGSLVKNPSLKLYEYVSKGKLSSNNNLVFDKDSSFKIPATNSNSYYRFQLLQDSKTGDVELKQVYGANYNYSNDKGPSARNMAQIFLDRQIYRPGQVVYFKVINTKLIGDKESVVPKATQEIKLEDANGEELAKQSFTTNDFGSYNGSFTLPKSKLNGNFTLVIDDEKLNISEQKDFLVEEYKRPTFELNFEPIKGEYKYGQKIELKGKATMFSGVPLSNSNIQYEIKKENIRWRYFSWYPRIYDNENSILGETKTNDKGEFTIVLDLKKDEKLEGVQVDQYSINASATDIAGETQSADTSLTVSSVSHYIDATPLKDQFSDEDIKLNVATKNYNNQNLNKSYHAKLTKLEEPQRVFRSQFKNQIQDLPKFSKPEFVNLFPNDRFDKSDLPKNWNTERVVFDKTAQDSLFNIGKLNAGYYRLDFYNIEGKDSIKTSQDFQVWSKSSLDSKQKTFLNASFDKKEYKVGETANLMIYSAVPDAIANIYVQNGDGNTVFERKTLKNGFLVYPVKISQKAELLNVQVVLAGFNDVQTENIYVPINGKEDALKIETTTFRDKLQPNSKEKWTLKVSGAENEKVLAEVLANMYDMSLDKFAANNYQFNNIYYRRDIVNEYRVLTDLKQLYYNKRLQYVTSKSVVEPQFNWMYSDWMSGGSRLRGQVAGLEMAPPAPVANKVMIRGVASLKDQSANYINGEAVVSKKGLAYNKVEVVQGIVPEPMKNSTDFNAGDKSENIKVRENLNETAFFYPNLVTDDKGNVSFEFTTPEALTKWKLMLLAHTKDAKSGYLEKTVVTQKDFSVTPNYPRFLREGDVLTFQTKISSLVSKALTGYAKLQILDAFTNEDISEKFKLTNLTQVTGYNIEQSFSLKENSSTALSWTLTTPKDVSSIIIKVVAQAGNYSDGEQKAVAVLPNRMLVTDAVPIFVKEGETKTFEIENLINNNSTTVSNVRNTLELTTNPIWEVMFALPSLKNETKNSADVIFNKWFADVIASEVFRSNPRMKTIFDEYQSKGLLTSNLDKNQELKQLLLDETPWMLESKTEEEQMTKLARLFDANTMRNSILDDWNALLQLQNPDGGFSWYAGYPSSYYSSLYILKNLGKLNLWLKDNVKDYQSDSQKEMIGKLINYVDNNVNRYWDVRKENPWSNASLEYLDARHYWEKDYPLTANPKALKNLVIKKAKTAKITDFTFFGLHRAAMLLDQYGLKDVSTKLMTYLKETSTDSKTQGAYWKQNLDDWGWYSSKVVNHAAALEAFNTLKPNDIQFIEDLKIWLITQKEVNSWGTSRNTAEVIFTILNSGKSWTTPESDKATIVWGNKDLNLAQQKATGYIKMSEASSKVDKSLGKVTVTKTGAGVAQGGLFWQYYEDLDKIKSSESYISIKKEYFKKVKTENGEELKPIAANTALKVGDKITVRMILNTDRNMEYVQLKDMRAAGTEPLDVISGYQWKNNLGYYQSTKDASTNFYIESMPKGKYVFEYDLVANASGMFSTGISTLQNYYAPQMNSHTAGSKLEIKE
ncbi:MG2 domain-containing protein [Soonwooa sp.]|uniref:alpha-2-macroglobulin family protein n=1 Tax=Soonwooa sp. TaxID=1938592 RepID=UPI0026304083|nr:MG2 domain-containing protein [Soonwooa sp.]